MSAAVAFAVASTAVKIFGGSSRRRAARRAAARRAAILRAQAEEKRRVVGLRVNAFKKQTQIQMGENISAFAKAGVDISQSPLLILTQNATEASRQATEIQRAGFEEARLIEIGAQNAIAAGNDEIEASRISDVGTLLGGVGSLFKKAEARAKPPKPGEG